MTKEKKTQDVSIKKKNASDIPSMEYADTLADVKNRIRDAQIKAVNLANQELLRLYWSIGKTIADRQEQSGWGSNFIEKLAKDLHNDFPKIEGFSRSNLFRMKAFYKEYTKVAPAVRQFNDLEKLGVLFQLPWSHN